MPQRAIIEEETGKREVHAYQLSDQQWIGVIEASKAGVLKLPCCGEHALARDPHGMVRHFSHPPYTLDHCEAKTPDATRDYIIVKVAEMVEHLGWKVTTEAKLADSFCDLVCYNPHYNFSIGIEIESGRRENSELLKLDSDLKNNGILRVQWFFKKGRRGGYPDVANKFVCSMQDRQSAAKVVTEECHRILSELNDLFNTAANVCDGLIQSGLEHKLYKKAGMPDHVVVNFEEGQETHRIDLSPSKVKMWNPRIALLRQNIDRGDIVGQQQKTLIAIVSENLAAGAALWWDGYPRLLADSFQRLREDIELADHKRRNRPACSENEAKAGSQTNHNNEYHQTAGANLYSSFQNSNVLDDVERMDSGFVELRLKEARCILKDYYGENYTEEIMDISLKELEGLSPRQLVEGTSQSAEKLYIALGYRDPVTKRPIKKLPQMIM